MTVQIDTAAHLPTSSVLKSESNAQTSTPHTSASKQDTSKSQMDARADPSDLTSNHTALQQMYELETIQWRGGDLYWNGPHDEFCFVCGGSMELFGCQTCENCYHAHCMSPTIEADEVPTFWFCPHCVNRDLHIPPDSPTSYFTPVLVPDHANPQVESTGSAENVMPEPQTPMIHPSEWVISTQRQSNSAHQDRHRKQDDRVLRNPTQVHVEEAAPTQHTEEPNPTDSFQKHIKRGRSKRSQSPPRKKSKYSAFSAEVDKALAVIYGELETAAENGKSENRLQNKIRSLEQQLKLQDGQLMLTKRELEVTRKELANERFKNGRFEAEVRGPKEEIARLKELVAKKDTELNDWRAKLKSMIGSGLE